MGGVVPGRPSPVWKLLLSMVMYFCSIVDALKWTDHKDEVIVGFHLIDNPVEGDAFQNIL
jgi:hypothetical protein